MSLLYLALLRSDMKLFEMAETFLVFAFLSSSTLSMDLLVDLKEPALSLLGD